MTSPRYSPRLYRQILASCAIVACLSGCAGADIFIPLGIDAAQGVAAAVTSIYNDISSNADHP